MGPTSCMDRGTRDKVVNRLTQIFTSASQSNTGLDDKENTENLAKAIENELSEQFGAQPKDYRAHARSLIFNLGREDGELRRRIFAGEVSVHDLVTCRTESLAPDAMQLERKEAQDKYFREQVHLKRTPSRRVRF